jgi:DNA-binding XRE family transcriptional regulator
MSKQNAHKKMITKWMKNSKFKMAYDSLEDEFLLFDVMLAARQKAGLTQEEVAERMGTKKSAIARLEASGGKEKHSPSISTLRKYAEATNCHLVVKFEHC